MERTITVLRAKENLTCISDEAHRTQTGVGAKLKKTDKGVFTTYGFAKYLRDSFPNATYCGFTGTPIDETIAVFGRVVDSYTMKESSDDGITVRIAYEPRLARVIVSDEQAKEIEKYYQQCAAEGSNPEQIEESKRAMSRMSAILGHPDRLKKLAADVVAHYESLCTEKPEVVQKAMIVCADRPLAFKVLKAIEAIRPEWFVKKKAEHEDQLTREQLDKLVALPMINMVATQGQNDEKELYDLCGTKEYRKMLDRQFKNNDSNFRIAVVVDMWITGFDVPSLAVMYIDKPLQKHTLIQTISRVNRVFDGKDRGLVVDYIGIKNDMMEAVKKYGGPQESPIDELNITLSIFRNHLALIDELLDGFNASKFFSGTPLERLNCLNAAAEYVQLKKEMQTRFMGLSRRLKSAYMICFPSGELTDAETAKAQFYLAIRSIIYKQTKGDAPDAEVMNSVVEEMVKDAITCTGIENIVDEHKYMKRKQWWGACHASCSALYVALSELGYSPKLCIGEMLGQGLYFDHSWIELDGQILDIAISMTLLGGAPVSEPIVFGKNIRSGKEPVIKYGVPGRGIEGETLFVNSLPFVDYMDGFPDEKNGLWGVVQELLGRKVDIPDLREKYKDVKRAIVRE